MMLKGKGRLGDRLGDLQAKVSESGKAGGTHHSNAALNHLTNCYNLGEVRIKFRQSGPSLKSESFDTAFFRSRVQVKRLQHVSNFFAFLYRKVSDLLIRKKTLSIAMF
jgi:hypothetical protein